MAVRAIHLARVAHQGGESTRVGLHVVLAQGGEPVLPTGEPDPHGANVILAGAFDELIDQAEIVLALFGFDPIPRDAGQDGVHVDLAGEQRPHHLHAFDIGRYGVAQFAAEYEEGLAIHHQLSGMAALFQMGNRGSRRFGLCARHQGQGAQQDCGDGEPYVDHVVRL